MAPSVEFHREEITHVLMMLFCSEGTVRQDPAGTQTEVSADCGDRLGQSSNSRWHLRTTWPCQHFPLHLITSHTSTIIHGHYASGTAGMKHALCSASQLECTHWIHWWTTWITLWTEVRKGTLNAQTTRWSLTLKKRPCTPQQLLIRPLLAPLLSPQLGSSNTGCN